MSRRGLDADRHNMWPRQCFLPQPNFGPSCVLFCQPPLDIPSRAISHTVRGTVSELHQNIISGEHLPSMKAGHAIAILVARIALFAFLIAAGYGLLVSIPGGLRTFYEWLPILAYLLPEVGAVWYVVRRGRSATVAGRFVVPYWTFLSALVCFGVLGLRGFGLLGGIVLFAGLAALGFYSNAIAIDSLVDTFKNWRVARRTRLNGKTSPPSRTPPPHSTK